MKNAAGLALVKPRKASPQVVETPFYIAGTGDSTRPRSTLKHGDCFAVVDSFGDMGATPGGSDGLFFCDTRHLSYLEIMLNGQHPLLLGSSVRDDNSLLTVDLTNPDIFLGEKLALAKAELHVVRTVFLWGGAAYQRFRFTNHGLAPFDVRFSLTFASDFADLFEVRGMHRTRRGTVDPLTESHSRVRLRYEGLDRTARSTVIAFDPTPTRLTNSLAAYDFQLQADESRSIYTTISCKREGREEAPLTFGGGLRGAFRDRRIASKDLTTIVTSNHVFNEVLCRSMADLAILTTGTPQGPYPYAGTPWYSTTFGRDGIITALQTLWCNAEVAKGVLRRLAYYQAVETDSHSDSQPGKILHEMRDGEMAALGEVPFRLYYGSADATPLFVLLAGYYAEHTGDWDTLRELWPNVEAALAWIDGPGDPDNDGFVEYHRADEQGLVNQGWKDSLDSVFHADGSLAEGPIALCEVQGYVYAAKSAAARCAKVLNKDALAEQLNAQATTLAARFEASFWCERLGTYALALDGEKRPCCVRTSNAGQVLFSGISAPDHAAAVMRDLMRPSFFSGWGIRTLAREEKRYNPMSYHNGSVWPHDNSLIAAGFARYGHKTAVERILTGIFAAASYMDLRRLPELYCGFQRGRERGPTLYPVACSPQAWAAGTPLLLLQSCLGLEFDSARNEILLRKPRLPSFLAEVTLRNLRLGASSIDLLLRRHDGDVSVQVLRNDGHIRVAAVYD